LDGLTNPYGASLRVLDALAALDEPHAAGDREEDALRRRIAQGHGVGAEAVLLANGLDELLTTLFLWWRPREEPVLLFPPAEPGPARHAALHGVETIDVHRGESFRLELDAALAVELPPESLALVDSPNDPTGSVLAPQEAVRLARACRVVVVDERHVEYGARTLLPLVREFENVIVLRTFETWAGLFWLPIAYAVGPTALIRELSAYRPSGAVAAGALVAAGATLDDLAYVQATVRRVREERSRLYRALRKLNMVRPFPSWANFLLTRVERGGRARVVRELARRGVAVHEPQQPGLAEYLRISATRPEQTDALRRALVEMAADL
jgi:histidinol-phosphate aminotransferase